MESPVLGLLLVLPLGVCSMIDEFCEWFDRTFTEFGQRVIFSTLLLILAVLTLGWER